MVLQHLCPSIASKMAMPRLWEANFVKYVLKMNVDDFFGYALQRPAKAGKRAWERDKIKVDASSRPAAETSND